MSASATGVHQIAGVFAAAPAAAEQANANGGISVRAADQLGLNKHQSGGSSRAADKSAAVEMVGGVLLIGVAWHGAPPCFVSVRFLRILLGFSPRRVAKKKHRSEEHTSELQSPCNIVCRLLLEKKKT